eukprot:GFYU01015112.1.p1 GENE.GFYU01015112.1~~GFYU01015112.1.p1  ORF type:complete len:223 (-),score=47.07 GFYU01015112.1:107-775(-)
MDLIQDTLGFGRSKEEYADELAAAKKELDDIVSEINSIKHEWEFQKQNSTLELQAKERELRNLRRVSDFAPLVAAEMSVHTHIPRDKKHVAAVNPDALLSTREAGALPTIKSKKDKDANKANPVYKQGVLYKKSPSLTKAWKKRWAVLQETTLTLFESEMSPVIVKEISLWKAVVTPDESAPLFTLWIHPGTVRTFKCDTFEEFSDWLINLSKAVKAANHRR